MRVNLRKPPKNKPEKIKTKGETKASPKKRGGIKAAAKTFATEASPEAAQSTAHADGMAATASYAAKHQKSPATRRANVEKHLKTARGGK